MRLRNGRGFPTARRALGMGPGKTGGSPRPNSSRAFSDNIHFWNEGTLLLKPAFPWELVQMGNGGSPIETDAGWLVLRHGVGPMRKYCIGAFFLDRDDSAKVIGRLREPLLKPNRNERRRVRPHPQPPRLHGARPHPAREDAGPYNHQRRRTDLRDHVGAVPSSTHDGFESGKRRIEIRRGIPRIFAPHPALSP